MDTPGLLGIDTHHDFDHFITSHTLEQLKKANIIAFVIDGKEGVSSVDEQLSKILFRFDVPKIVLVNKCEGKNKNEYILDASVGLVCHFASTRKKLLLKMNAPSICSPSGA